MAGQLTSYLVTTLTSSITAYFHGYWLAAVRRALEKMKWCYRGKSFGEEEVKNNQLGGWCRLLWVRDFSFQFGEKLSLGNLEELKQNSNCSPSSQALFFGNCVFYWRETR
uniref:Uncharacterized protein n=1 Tax=Salix viminalis TaxID=40686 RepID=A0A6N2K0R8_SALVM